MHANNNKQYMHAAVEQRAVPWEARRDRHRAAGHGAGGALHSADQRVRAGHRRRRAPGGAGDAVPPLVRPDRRLPPLRHPVEPRRDRLPRRRRPHQALRRRQHDVIPGQGDVGVRLHLGRLRLGHRRRPLQGRLPLPALPGGLPDVQDRRMRGRRARRRVPTRAGVPRRRWAQRAAA